MGLPLKRVRTLAMTTQHAATIRVTDAARQPFGRSNDLTPSGAV
ncbi:MAG TPA: hypothetical protein VLW50_07615 [Streptosporangiaceae bacterium]|nr:hypothetical protein [Streptosporangiaceae bacterium]